jgi:hypothetical protein
VTTKTKTEQERWILFREIGCIVCRRYYHIVEPADVHHLLSGGKRRGHHATIPLCPYHHRGIPIDGMSNDRMRARLGPSLALQSKAFHAKFGSDDYLLEETEKELDIVRSLKV